MKKRTTWKGLKAGTRFKVIANLGGHNYIIGQTYEMNQDGGSTELMNNIARGHSGNSIRISEVQILDYKTLKELKEEIVGLEKQIQDLKEKVKFCTANKLEEYDVETHKLYEGIKIVEAASTTMEKALALKKLLSE